MNDLVALLLPGGDRFVTAVARAWDAGDAVLPLDPGAPRAHTDRLLRALRPTHVVESDGEQRALDDGEPVHDDDALVIATSGTTGEPKGVVHTRRGVEQAAFATATATGVADDTWWLACLPLSHVGGFSVVSRAMVTEARLEVHPSFVAADVDDAARRGATHVSLVPTVLDRIDARPWRTILLGGSAIPDQRPANTIATYGMTETLGGVVYDGLALPGVSVRIVDDLHDDQRSDDQHPDDRRRVVPVDPGAVGAIEISSATLLRCYRDGTDPGGEGTDPVGPDGWYRTGDLGSVDPSTGRLRVLGRADDLIITGGEKVWPAPVESILAMDHRVHEVAVVGRPDPEWGARVVAVVVPTDRAEPPTLQGLRDLVRTELPRAAAPKELELVDSLPRTGLGKIRRTLLSPGGPRHDGPAPDGPIHDGPESSPHA
ncbi:MAG: class I adenylate-forming enzyme family protein [Microthrixaceae bacterium]